MEDYEKMISSPLITDPDRLQKAVDLNHAKGKVERWLETAASLDGEELPAFCKNGLMTQRSS